MFAFVTLGLALVLAIAAIHGVVTGTVMTKLNDVRRTESPKLFWFVVVSYFVFAAYLARMAVLDFAWTAGT